MRHSSWLKNFSVLVLLCSCSQVVSAEVYKWTDADGRVHFGDRPPESGARAVPLAKSSAAPAPSAEQRLEKQNKLLNAFEAERQQRLEVQDQAQQEKAERERNCNEARDRLQAAIRSTAIYSLDAAGERVYLDEAQREQSILRRRKDVEAWCGKS